MPKYVVACSDQGRNAPYDVMGFLYCQEYNLHAWKGLISTSMKELATQVNEASEALRSLGMDTAFVTLRVVEIDGKEDSKVEALLAANAELLGIIDRYQIPTPQRKAA